MKKWLTIILLMIGIMGVAAAETVGDLVPETALWGSSEDALKAAVQMPWMEERIDRVKCLKVNQVMVNDYPMDGFYLFGENMWDAEGKSYMGLSRVVYVLSGQRKYAPEELKAIYQMLADDMKASLGQPESATGAVTTWQTGACQIQIGSGKFAKYSGSKDLTVGIIISGQNIPKPTLKAVVTPRPTPKPTPKPTPTPKPKAKSSSGGKDMKISIDTKCDYDNYNRVGKNWKMDFFVNGQMVRDRSKIHVVEGDQISVKAKIIEDDQYDDEGEGSKTYTITEQDLRKGFTISLNIKVVENAGRYAGNDCTWHVKFKFT